MFAKEFFPLSLSHELFISTSELCFSFKFIHILESLRKVKSHPTRTQLNRRRLERRGRKKQKNLIREDRKRGEEKEEEEEEEEKSQEKKKAMCRRKKEE